MIDPNRPILVTGASGFAGAYVVRELHDAGYRVVALDIGDYRPESRFVIGDAIDAIVTERGSYEELPFLIEVMSRHRPSAVVHLAAFMDAVYLDQHPLAAVRSNVEGAMKVLEAARLTGVDRVVLTSSVAVMSQVEFEPITASHPVVAANWGPLGAYGASKVAMEAFAFVYQQVHGLEIRIIRPSALYGFAMSWFAPNYVKQIVEPAAQGQPVRLANGGRVPRDYIHVTDLARLYRLVLEGPDEADRLLFAATGHLSHGSDVGDAVRELIPGAEVEVGDGWTEDDIIEARIRGVIDVSHQKEQLGWEPVHYDVRSGVADYLRRIDEYRAAGGVLTPPPPGLRAPGA